MITHEILEITPALAAEMLEHNNNNRPLSQAFVKSYSDTMKRGEWMLNGEDIILDTEGNILNGQHRLQAIIASGCTVQFGVQRGVEAKAFGTYDNGRNRTAGQLLQMQGYANGNTAAAIVKTLRELRSGIIGNIQCKDGGSIYVANKAATKLTNMQIITLFDNERGRILNAISNTGYVKDVRRFPLSRSIIAAYYVYLQYDLGYEPEVIDKFFKGLVSYRTCANPYIDGLRLKMLQDMDGTTHMDAKRRVNLLYVTWNDCMTEKPIKIRKNGKLSAYIPYWREDCGLISILPRKSFEGRQLLLDLTTEE